MTILSFGALFAGFGVTHGVTGDAVVIVLGVLLGSTAWWLVLTTAIGAMRMRVTPAWIGRINVASGVVIGVFAVVVIASARGRRPVSRKRRSARRRSGSVPRRRHAAARIRLSAPAKPAVPDIAVSRKHPLCFDRVELGQRRQRLVRLQRERCGPRSHLAGQDASRRHGVAHEDRVDRGDVDRRSFPACAPAVWMTRGAPGRSRVAPSSNVTTSVSGGTRRPPRRPLYARKPRSGPIFIGTPTRGRFLDLAAGAIGVQRVDVDGHASLATQPLGKADVVGVAVRQDDAANVIERPAHGGELGRQVAPIAGQAGVDDRDASRRPRRGSCSRGWSPAGAGMGRSSRRSSLSVAAGSRSERFRQVVAEEDEHRLIGDDHGRRRQARLQADPPTPSATAVPRSNPVPMRVRVPLREPVLRLRRHDKRPHDDEAKRRSDAEHDRRHDGVRGI